VNFLNLRFGLELLSNNFLIFLGLEVLCLKGKSCINRLFWRGFLKIFLNFFWQSGKFLFFNFDEEGLRKFSRKSWARK
jgi:hypothetical protein